MGGQCTFMLKFLLRRKSNNVFDAMPEKKVIVSNECATVQGAGQWASYCAVLLDEDGNRVFEDFIVQLYLDGRVVTCVYLKPDIYNPYGEVRIAFQVPKEYSPGKYRMYLHWPKQMDPKTLTVYLEGDSPGLTYTVAPSVKVSISNCSILHPQAPGQWTSFRGVLLDEFGNVLPEPFYLQIFSSSDVPVHVPISEFLGYTDSVKRVFRTSYRVDVAYPVTVKIDGVEVPKEAYVVHEDSIEFYKAPSSGGCPGMKVTADYTAYTAGSFPLGGVHLSSEVYDREGKLQFSFQVPLEFQGKTYPAWVAWGTQVVSNICYLSGSSDVLPLVVTTDVRDVVVTNEWVEFSHVYPGDWTSYHATVYDEKGEALPEEVPTELLLGERVVARAFLTPDVYNPVTKEVKLAFQVPTDVSPGTYPVRLKWYEHVTGGELP